MSREFYDVLLEYQLVGSVLCGVVTRFEFQSIEDKIFYDKRTRALFKAACHLISNKKTINFLHLCYAFKELSQTELCLEEYEHVMRVGDEAYLNISESIARLKDLYLWRRLKQLNSNLKAVIDDDSAKVSPEKVFAKHNEWERECLATAAAPSFNKRSAMLNVMNRYYKEPSKERIFETGLNAIDSLTNGGLYAGRLYAIGAKYGCGKTTLLGGIADNMNYGSSGGDKFKTLFVSMETPIEDIEIRNIAKHLGINALDITDDLETKHHIFTKNVEKELDSVEDNTFYVYDTNMTIEKLLFTIKHHVAQHDIKGVFIDYWQSIRGRERNELPHDFANRLGTELAKLCRNENIWCVITVQSDETERFMCDILKTVSTYIEMFHEPNDECVTFEVRKNNYGKLRTYGNDDEPAAIFDVVGPHFRNPD